MKLLSKMLRFFLIILFCSVILFASLGSSKEQNLAHKGQLKLLTWDPNTQGVVPLDGEWEFYWNTFITPDLIGKKEVTARRRFIQVPGRWNGYQLKDQVLDGQGIASFRLKIWLPENITQVYFNIPEISTAYQFWVNGELLKESGHIARHKTSMKPWFSPQLVAYTVQKNPIEIIVNVSNFYHKDGGIWRSIELGTQAHIIKMKEIPFFFDTFIFGILLIMGMYHVGLFLVRRTDLPSLFFGLFCLLIGIRAIMVGTRISYLFLPNISWVIQQKLEFLSLYLSSPAFSRYIFHLYPQEIKKHVIDYYTVFCLILCAIVVGSPNTFYAHTGNLFQFITFLLIVYFLWILQKAIQHKREGGGLFLIGFLILIVTAVNDALYTHMVFHTRNLIHVGVFLFIFVQAFLLSRKNATAYTQIEALSRVLQKKNQELLSLDNLKNEFLANTSHELKTPLHGILGISDSMIDGATGEINSAQKKHLEMIGYSANRLFSLIDDLIDFSRIEKNDLKLVYRPVDLKELIELVVSMVKPLISNKKLTLTSKIPQDLPLVKGDENRLQQILYNLLGNAIKFTLNGAIRIEALGKEDFVCVQIVDTGIGIAQKDQDRIFKAFDQVDGSPGKKFEGTGLGLAITKKLIELHHGSIRIESELNKGSTFSFTIPISGDQERAKTEKSPAAGQEIYWPPRITTGAMISTEQKNLMEVIPECSVKKDSLNTSKHVLIVDDEIVNRQLVHNILHLEGYQVISGENGYHAIELLDEKEPDIVLLDIMMPGMNGFEVCQQIRQRYNLYELPIIFLSIKNQIRDLEQGLQYGANDYITKPFHKKELLARVETHLKAKEAVVQLRENRRLKKEIQKRKQIEQALQTSQRRLTRMLDTAPDALILIDSFHTIVFFNQKAEALFGLFLDKALDKKIETLFPEKEKAVITEILHTIAQTEGDAQTTSKDMAKDNKVWHLAGLKNSGETFPLELRPTHFQLKNVNYFSFIICQPTAKEKKQPQIESINSALENISDLINQPHLNDIFLLRQTSPVLDGISDKIDRDDANNTISTGLVQIMSTALKFWETATGKSKVDLAEESGIWKAYLDGGTWKTRTMDKYLKIKTIPKKPRWREVVRTAHFVLKNTRLSEAEQKELKEMVQKTEELLQRK